MKKKNRQHNNILSYGKKGSEGVETFEFECRGCTMRGRDEKWQGFVSSIGGLYDKDHDNSYFILEEEPDNEYDPNAIMVVVKGEFFGTVGYVGREYTKAVKDILDKCSLYRLDMKSENDCGNKSISLIMSWVKENGENDKTNS